MRKTLIPLTFIATVVVNLGMLVFIPSCAAPDNSIRTEGEMAVIRQVFPSVIDIAEISQDVRVSGRPDDAKIIEIKGDSGILGYCVESKVVSRSGPFRIRVIFDKQLYVKQATVISYPWARGRDVCKRSFTDQFTGKGPKDTIRLGKDIDAMTGATISSRVMTDGVRDAIKLIKFAKEK